LLLPLYSKGFFYNLKISTPHKNNKKNDKLYNKTSTIHTANYISRNVIGVARVECDVDKLIGCRI
ncbi:hypothetical protein ACSLNR_29615, partial [Escherichia coli]|uniref:hypothetical protein n=1 Tax=Escherichia coli TaxID=562 RepID=UPI003EE27D6B